MARSCCSLGVGPEVVPLSGGRLAEPTRCPHPVDLVERLGERTLHAAGLCGQVGQNLTSTAPLFNIEKRRDEGEDDGVDRPGTESSRPWSRWSAGASPFGSASVCRCGAWLLMRGRPTGSRLPIDRSPEACCRLVGQIVGEDPHASRATSSSTGDGVGRGASPASLMSLSVADCRPNNASVRGPCGPRVSDGPSGPRGPRSMWIVVLHRKPHADVGALVLALARTADVEPRYGGPQVPTERLFRAMVLGLVLGPRLPLRPELVDRDLHVAPHDTPVPEERAHRARQVLELADGLTSGRRLGEAPLCPQVEAVERPVHDSGYWEEAREETGVLPAVTLP